MAARNDETRETRLRKGTKPHIISIGEAFGIVREIYHQGGGQASVDLLSKITGNSISSSSFFRKLNALKAYGLLVELQGAGQFGLTDTAMAIAAPQNVEAEATAKKQTFLKVEMFNRIYERHKGKLLPADEFLRNIIEQDCGVPREWAEVWAGEFKKAAKNAGLLRERDDGKTQILESPILRFPRLPTESAPEPDLSKASPVKQPEATGQSMTPSVIPSEISGHLTRIEISGGRYAVLAIPDGLTKRDAHRLKGALTGLTQIIDSMVEEEDLH